MKKLLVVLSFLSICTFAIAHTIEWYVGDNLLSTTTCNSGENITPPTAPTKYGYTFDGWDNGCVELEYIESNAGQYIGTRIATDENTVVELDVTHLYASNTVIIGTGWEQSFSIFSVAEDGNKLIFYFGSRGINVQAQQRTRNTIKLQLGKVTLNGVEQTYSYTTPSVGTELYINSLSDHSRGGEYRYYRVTIWQGNTLVRNFIPAKCGFNNEIGMYDTVTETFFTNQGTGEFIAGPVVGGL